MVGGRGDDLGEAAPGSAGADDLCRGSRAQIVADADRLAKALREAPTTLVSDERKAGGLPTASALHAAVDCRTDLIRDRERHGASAVVTVVPRHRQIEVADDQIGGTAVQRQIGD